MGKYRLGTFFVLLLGIFSTSYSISHTKVLNLSEHPIRFAVLGDRTGSHVPGIYGKVVEEIERMKPDFVITVGDMIEGYTDDTIEVNNEWEEYKSLIAPLSMPIYFIPGNHDIWDDLSEELYKRHIGSPYYSLDINGLHFIILDNSRWESSTELPGEQIQWLINDLYGQQDAAYTFVFLHKPFWFETVANDEPDTLHSLFRDFGVDAIFTGHYHIYFSGEYDGIFYTSVGSSGASCTPGPTGIEYQFIWVTVDENGISIAPINMNSVLPWEDVTATDLKFINKIYFLGMNFKEPLPVDERLNVTAEKSIVTFKNLSDFELNDTLHWGVPEGWSVEPTDLPVIVTKKDSIVVDFNVENEGKLYPVPELSLDFPYSEGKTYKIEKQLPIARKAYCYRADIPPVIDGNISESGWQEPVSLLFSPQGNPIEIDSVYFYFSYDQDNLYIAAYCKDFKMDALVATVIDHDGAVYNEDCVGYFFQPDMERGVVYQIYFNPLGTVFDQKILKSREGEMEAKSEWDGIYEVGTTKGIDFWCIEARIPLEQFEVSPGKNWGINIRRKQKRFDSAADWQVPISYDPATYGVLIMK